MRRRPHTIDGKTLYVRRMTDYIDTTRLHVSGVEEQHTVSDFFAYFEQFGTVTKVSRYVSDQKLRKNVTKNWKRFHWVSKKWSN